LLNIVERLAKTAACVGNVGQAHQRQQIARLLVQRGRVGRRGIIPLPFGQGAVAADRRVGFRQPLDLIERVRLVVQHPGKPVRREPQLDVESAAAGRNNIAHVVAAQDGKGVFGQVARAEKGCLVDQPLQRLCLLVFGKDFAGVRRAVRHNIGLGDIGRDRYAQILDRKSTRLNSSHVKTSYAVFCLKKKTPATWRSTSGSTTTPSTYWWRNA